MQRAEADLTENVVVRRLIELAGDRPNDEIISDLVTTLTVDELMGRAASVAQQLLDRRVSGPVVLLVDRTVASVAAIIGSFWAGVTLVPLDANEPAERLEDILNRTEATSIIDATGCAEQSGLPLEVVPASTEVLARSEWPPNCPVAANSPSLLLFTSGSTGRAKGVLRTVEDLSQFVATSMRSGAFYAARRTAVCFPVHFLAGLNAAVLALSTGRFTVVVDPLKPSLDEVLQQLGTRAIEQMMLPVSLLRSIVATQHGTWPLKALRDLFTMGEPLYWSDVEGAARALGPNLSVSTMYGSTEGNGFFGMHTVSTSGPFGDGLVPLGRPLAPAEVRVDFDVATDEQRSAGIGELIFRRLLSTGYVEDEQNQARFGVDPDGVRTWRSGDLVFLDEDGVLHHQGRVDDMVKINGRLVEPAEAERVLRGIPGIRNVAVLPRALAEGRHQLVAHIEANASMSADLVREAMQRELSAHLVPAVMVRHDMLPLTDRGKVDRMALTLAPVVPWRDRSTSSELPYRLGAPVLGIVSRILDLPELSPDDVLWNIGCDSLAAIEIASEIVDAFGSTLAPNDLVTARTVREICERIEAGGAEQRSFAVEYHSYGSQSPIFMIPGAGSPAMLLHMVVTGLGEDQPVVVLEPRGLHQFERPDRTLSAVVRRNLKEVRRRQPAGPYVVLGRSYGGIVAHEMATRLTASGEDVTLILLDTHRNRIATPTDRPRRERPERLRSRVDAPPVYLAKLMVWKVAVARRILREWLVGRRSSNLGPIGSVERYDAFGRIGLEILRRDVRPVIDVPVWYVHPSESSAVDSWRDHPQLTTVETGGNHFTMVNPPNTDIVVTAIREAARGGSNPEHQHPHFDQGNLPQ